MRSLQLAAGIRVAQLTATITVRVRVLRRAVADVDVHVACTYTHKGQAVRELL